MLLNILQNTHKSEGWGLWALSETISRAPYYAQQTFFETLIIPAYDSVIMLRKLMIRQKITAAIADGTTQIVNIGGGYDIGMIATLLGNPNVKGFELDRGPTREFKLKGLKTIPKGIGFDHIIVKMDGDTLIVQDNLQYINCDLVEDDLEQVLRDHGFQPNKKTLFLLEGVTTYLSREENGALLQDINTLMSDDSEILISYLSKLRENRSEVENRSLAAAKETYKLVLPPEEVMSFVAPYGFDICQKYVSSSHLRVIGDPSASYYEKNPDAAKEWYFSLRKSGLMSNKTLDMIPSMILVIPDHSPASTSSWNCNVM